MFKIKNYTLIIVILICMVNIACQKHKIPPDLLTADSIMDRKPDSAYTILSKIIDVEELEDGDKALFLLLNTQAKWKTNRDIRHDSLLDISIDYFHKIHDNVHLAKSYYYKGVVCEEKNYEMEALHLYLKAHDVIQKTNNRHYSMFINEYIGNIYQKQYLNNDAYKYYQYAYKDATIDNDTTGIVSSLIRINYYYLYKDNYTKILNNGMKTLSLLRQYRIDSSAVKSAFGDIALAYFHLKKFNKAIQYNDSAMKYTTDSAGFYILHALYGSIFLETGKLDLAEKYFNICKKGHELQDSIVYAEGMYKIAVHNKNFENTVRFGSEFANIYKNLYENDTRYKFIKLQKEYDEAQKDKELNLAKIDNLNLKLILSLFVFATILIGLSLYWIIRKHVKIKKDKERMTEELADRDNKIKEHEAKETENNDTINYLKSRISEIEDKKDINEYDASKLTELRLQLEKTQNNNVLLRNQIKEKRINLAKLISNEYDADLDNLKTILGLKKNRMLTEKEWQSVYRLINVIDPSLLEELEEIDNFSIYDKEITALSVLGARPKTIALIYNTLATSVSREKNRIKHKILECGNNVLYVRIDNLFQS
jgi:hypothetical protein